MESDTKATPSDFVNNGSPRTRPLHRRTSGPTRRSTKGQWTPEEDEILHMAVQRFKGKNWKKIAECFKDRTDVQCLHRWQKVLNPELVKGPWSKEEDEIIVELVKKYGPKKWSTIAQHLPGRIGKQCRERWHNHLNPGINKEAWTQEEELTLIRAHQVYGNKWAELTKFLPGRTDNSIKNHWNSSVKKKLDSYLASGLLAQFPGLPHGSHQILALPSSSRVQQSSGDENASKGGTEAEEASECSQGSAIVCSQSASDVGNQIVDTREEFVITDSLIHKDNMSSTLESFSETYHAAFQNVAASMPEVHSEPFNSSMLVEPNFLNDSSIPSGKTWQLNLDDLASISPMDLLQDTSGVFTNYLHGSENIDVVPLSTQTAPNLIASASTENMALCLTTAGHMLSYEDAGCSGRCLEMEDDECIPSQSDFAGVDGSAGALIYSSSKDIIQEGSTSGSQSCNFLSSNNPGATSIQSFPVSPQVPHDKSLISGSTSNQLSTSSLGGLKQECSMSRNDGYISSNNEYVSSSCVGGEDNTTPKEHFEQKVVPVNDFCSVRSYPLVSEKPSDKDGGALCYEPPRFPSLDIPFLNCDLVQSGSDMLQEFSPLGIRQLMMSTMQTPFKLWDLPSRDNSPEAVLRSAAKTFMGTPSILKKRHRDFISPLSEKRSEKKVECDLKQESFSSLARDFSQLEVMFNETENEHVPTPSNKEIKVEDCNEDKENIRPTFEEERKDALERRNMAESDCSDPPQNMELQPATENGKSEGEAADPGEKSIGVLMEHDINEMLFVSPDTLGIKLSRTTGLTAIFSDHKCPRKSETASSKGVGTSSMETSSLSVVCSPRILGRKDGKYLVKAACADSTSTALENMGDSSGCGVGCENMSIFGETPFKRSIESPSAWKSPWFLNSFLPGPRVDTNISVEDFCYLMSTPDRMYDAIGLMKQLNEHTAEAFADAQEVLGDDTPETILKGRFNKNQKADEDDPLLASNTITERRILDFSECGTPGKRTEGGKCPNANGLSSPSSHLLKGFR